MVENARRPSRLSRNALNTWSGECADYAKAVGTGWAVGDGKPEEPGTILEKTSMLKAYVKAQGWTLGSPVRDGDNNDCWDLRPGGFAERVRYCKNLTLGRYGQEASQYISYILQEIALDEATVMILLDTTQFRVLPPTAPWKKLTGRLTAGQQGGMRDSQLEVLQAWLKGERRRVILASHYPIDALDPDTIAALRKIIEANSIVTYISAHTHDRLSLRRHGEGWPEINVGSLLDWPMQYERMHTGVSTLPDGPAWGLYLSLFELPQQLAGVCAGLEPWKPASGEQDYPTAYLSCRGLRCFFNRVRAFNEAYAAVRAGMYQRLACAIPDAATEAELKQPALLQADPAVAAYELCQVVWASQIEDGTRSGLGKDPTYRELTLSPGSWFLAFSSAQQKAEPARRPACSTGDR